MPSQPVSLTALTASCHAFCFDSIIIEIGITVSAEPAPNAAAVIPAARPRRWDYSVTGFELSASQKRASTSHFLEQNVCVSRALLVLRRYWE
jgi:hypothetical protein